MSINKVILIGNVGIDPEIKVLSNDTKVAKISVATSESYNDKDGNKVEKTQWHTIIAWRWMADVCEKYISKGSKVYIEGKLEYRTFEQNGQQMKATDIISDKIEVLSSINQ